MFSTHLVCLVSDFQTRYTEPQIVFCNLCTHDNFYPNLRKSQSREKWQTKRKKMITIKTQCKNRLGALIIYAFLSEGIFFNCCRLPLVGLKPISFNCYISGLSHLQQELIASKKIQQHLKQNNLRKVWFVPFNDQLYSS